jgi:hypothetical protein
MLELVDDHLHGLVLERLRPGAPPLRPGNNTEKRAPSVAAIVSRSQFGHSGQMMT